MKEIPSSMESLLDLLENLDGDDVSTGGGWVSNMESLVDLMFRGLRWE